MYIRLLNGHEMRSRSLCYNRLQNVLCDIGNFARLQESYQGMVKPVDSSFKSMDSYRFGDHESGL